MSRLGGSPARPAFKMPPRRGFSSARAAGAAHSPTTSITTESNHTPILKPFIILIIVSPCQYLHYSMARCPQETPPARLVRMVGKRLPVCAVLAMHDGEESVSGVLSEVQDVRRELEWLR